MTTSKTRRTSSSRGGADKGGGLVLVQAKTEIRGQGVLSGAAIPHLNGFQQGLKVKSGASGILVGPDPGNPKRSEVMFEYGNRGSATMLVPNDTFIPI